MKKLTTLASVIALASAMGWGAAVAGGPKAGVLHCGCNLAGDDMEYKEISISSKSRGHDAHLYGTVDSCYDGVETYTDVMRTGDDCQLSGAPLGDPIYNCDTFDPVPYAGLDCGMEPMAPQ